MSSPKQNRTGCESCERYYEQKLAGLADGMRALAEYRDELEVQVSIMVRLYAAAAHVTHEQAERRLKDEYEHRPLRVKS